MKNCATKLLGLLMLLAFTNQSIAQVKVKILQKDIEVEITKQDVLNSRYEETNLSITPSGKFIFFQSERPSGPDAKIYTASNGAMRYDANIWYAKKSGDSWTKPRVIGAPAGSTSNEDEPMVSPDGKTVAFQSWRRGWEYSGGPYYVSSMYGASWGSPKGMGSGINQFFVNKGNDPSISGQGTDGAAISPDGKKFVFTWGKDYYGKLDLYMCTKGSNGKWSYPKKMKISTPGDERSVFFGSDSKTIFFSSDGYKGFGGLDIFKAVIDDNGNASEVLNLGKRFNTARNDFGFIITANGEEAYFVRDHDIYRARIKNPPVELLPTRNALVRGTVKDNLGKAVKAKLKLVEVETGKVEINAFSNSFNGYYSMYVNDARKKYKVVLYVDGKKEDEAPLVIKGNHVYSEIILNFTITKEEEKVEEIVEEKKEPVKEPEPEPKKEPVEEKLPVVVEEPEVEKDSMIIVSDNAFERYHFSYKSARLTMKALFKLNSTVKFLKQNSAANILVTGYGEPIKNWEYNERISKERSIAVAQYLRNEDIDEERIIAEYFPRSYFLKDEGKRAVLNIRRVDLALVDKNDVTMADRNIIDLDTLPQTEMGGGFGLFGEYATDLKEINDFLMEHPEDASKFFERGLINYLMNDFNSALLDFDKAILLSSDNEEAYYYRAVVNYETGNYNEALADFNKAIELDDSNAMLFFYRGSVYQKLKKDTEACEDWNTAEKKSKGSAVKLIKSFCK